MWHITRPLLHSHFFHLFHKHTHSRLTHSQTHALTHKHTHTHTSSNFFLCLSLAKSWSQHSVFLFLSLCPSTYLARSQTLTVWVCVRMRACALWVCWWEKERERETRSTSTCSLSLFLSLSLPFASAEGAQNSNTNSAMKNTLFFFSSPLCFIPPLYSGVQHTHPHPHTHTHSLTHSPSYS